MKKIELLAPAGSFEALEAAVICGADAVYLGGTKFGARAFAANFSDEEIIKAVNYAHLYGVKIYITVNTLIYDDEVSLFLEYISFLKNAGVDAFIIQDIGMLHLLKSIYSDIELHASTQMHIHNIESLQKLKSLGIRRVVMPREYSLSQLASLKKESDMEIEVFIQGALCVSYSGQCLMSYLIGGRSGNRGECAGSCRLPYQLIEVDNNLERIIDTKGDYILSTKDLYTLNDINKIIESGVDSLKIEGRMKRPEYVALVTSLYRKAIDSYYEGTEYKVDEQDFIKLKKMFNRGFTKGYILNDKGTSLMNSLRPNHMGVPIGKIININKDYISIKLSDDIVIGDGIRIISTSDIGFTLNEIYKNNNIVKEAYKNDIVSINFTGDVNIGDDVLKTTDVKLIDSIRDSFKDNNLKIKLTCFVSAHIGKYLKITISDGINDVTMESEIVISPALNAPVLEDTLRLKLNKIGDTAYIFENINIEMDSNIFIPLAEINDVKRKALDKISELRTKKLPVNITTPYSIKIPVVEQKNRLIKAKIRTMEQYKACIDNNIDIIYIENIELYNSVKDNDKVILALPRVRKNIASNAQQLLVGDIGSISTDTMADYSLNLVNAYSVAFIHSMGANTVTLSYEMDIKKIESLVKTYRDLYLSNPNLEVIIYGRIEAMISEYCPINTYINKGEEHCNICNNKKKYYLRDRFNNDYVLTFDKCLMNIYDYKKRNMIKDINALSKIGVKNFRFNFVDESYEECCEILKLIK